MSVPSTASAVERRLTAKIVARGPMVAWARAWVSRDGRLHGIFAARTLDFVVVTTDRLHLVSIGFFTRRPRRVVYAMALDRLSVEDRQAKRGLCLRISTSLHRTLVLEMRENARTMHLADELLARTVQGSSW